MFRSPLHVVASFAGAVAVFVAFACTSDPHNSKKNKVSKGKADPEALFADEAVDDAAGATAKGTPKAGAKLATTPKAIGPVAKKKSPNWSVPGSPPTGAAPLQVETESDAVANESEAGQVSKVANVAKASESESTDADRRWSIVLLSFTGEDNALLAEAACVNVRGRYPNLAKSFVRQRSSGSVVVIGRFAGPGDPAVKPMLNELHSIVDGATRPFARAMLARLETSKESAMGAFDLRRARQANPTARALYSVEVAVWSDFGSNEISLEDIRKNAEAHTKKLRSQGFTAFFHHDDDRRMSIVTIGLFGPDAYNAQTMLHSSEVDAIKKKFPKLLVNGEELRRPIRKGSQETVADASLLIEVPR
ncbi:MAG: hypothetical protein EXS17_04965 [Phycisphaerales bacterium]|nr:hypothetical protein [Phycisphaerales bacterium]